MCGIAGLFSLGDRPVAEHEVQAMCDALSHRGPDDEGFYARPEVALGMRRLSIIDLDGGHQPVRNEDGSVWVVFNGEIYNFKALRTLLERQGHVFYTATDTEVIVHLYEQYGESFVDKLRGMFVLGHLGRTPQKPSSRSRSLGNQTAVLRSYRRPARVWFRAESLAFSCRSWSGG